MKQFQKKFIKTITADSIDILFKQAEINFSTHPERTKRYVKMIWDLAKKNNFRLSRQQKLRFCKKCFSLWVIGKSARASFDQCHNMFEIVCLDCGYKKRFK